MKTPFNPTIIQFSQFLLNLHITPTLTIHIEQTCTRKSLTRETHHKLDVKSTEQKGLSRIKGNVKTQISLNRGMRPNQLRCLPRGQE